MKQKYNEQLLASTRFYFAQSVFGSACHFQALNRLNKVKKRFSIFVKAIAALTLVLLVCQVIGLQAKWQEMLNVSAFVGIIITATSLVFEYFNSDRSQEIFLHKAHAEKYKTLRDEYMGLIESIMSGAYDDDELRNKRDQLQIRYSSIGENSPETTSSDYTKAQSAIGIGNATDEQFTWPDDQINKFLPQQLRI